LWVLSNYEISVQANKERAEQGDRLVPHDILLQTHEGAAINFIKLIHSEIPELSDKSIFNGTIKVVLNRSEVRYEPSPNAKIKLDRNKKPIQVQGVIKDFKYLTLKERGKPITTEKEVHDELKSWVLSNIPKTFLTKYLWPEAERDI